MSASAAQREQARGLGVQGHLFPASSPIQGVAGGAAGAQDAPPEHYVARVLRETNSERYAVAAMLEEAAHAKAFPRPYNPDADELRQLQNEARAAARALQRKQADKKRFEQFVAGLQDNAGAAMLDSGIGEELRDAGYQYKRITRQRNVGEIVHGQFVVRDTITESRGRLVHPKGKKPARRKELSLAERARQIGACGDNAVVFKVKGESAEHMPGRCRDRLCPACWRIDGQRLALALENVLRHERENRGRLGFLTLTIRHNASDPLKRVARKFRRAWALLIRRAFWRSAVGNYFRTIEVELTPNGWHFHAHVLVSIDRQARQKKLGSGKKTRVFEWGNDELEKKFQAEWLEVTSKLGRPSPVVNWQKVHGNEHKIISELCKYVTKKWGEGAKRGQVGFFAFTPQQVAELAHGIRHVKLHQHSDGWVELIEALDKPDEMDAEDDARIYTWAECKRLEGKSRFGLLTEEQQGAWEHDRPLIVACLKRAGFKAQARQLEAGHPPPGPPGGAP